MTVQEARNNTELIEALKAELQAAKEVKAELIDVMKFTASAAGKDWLQMQLILAEAIAKHST